MELYDKIHENEELKTYILAGNRVLGELGFTEHGLAHAGTVSKMSREILETLNYSDHECELVVIAVLVVVSMIGGAAYPAVLSRFRVNPNAQELESPYIQRNIDATRYAYGL